MLLFSLFYLLRWGLDISSLVYGFLTSAPEPELSSFVLVFTIPMVGIRTFLGIMFPCLDTQFLNDFGYCPDRAMINGSPLKTSPIFGAILVPHFVAGLVFLVESASSSRLVVRRTSRVGPRLTMIRSRIESESTINQLV